MDPRRSLVRIRINERDQRIVAGAEITEPTQVLIWREEFAHATHLKWYINTKGTVRIVHAPICVCLEPGWRCWKLGDTKLNIAYNPKATIINEWWQKEYKEYMSACPMYGDLVVFRWYNSVTSLTSEFREAETIIRNYLYDKYLERLDFSRVEIVQNND